ncbi:hypothetical protein Naga_102113g1 [Nannochloropsis gaditana]|uniref:Uncharacterized protein n=1 Tax=Nannochloropsis gaditana TaxID=72520 RepID=W7TCQ6_9STRA|nr:hypothetical protein Naga_102113g1 [Nannochloropsis gaditana]
MPLSPSDGPSRAFSALPASRPPSLAAPLLLQPRGNFSSYPLSPCLKPESGGIGLDGSEDGTQHQEGIGSSGSSSSSSSSSSLSPEELFSSHKTMRAHAALEVPGAATPP